MSDTSFTFTAKFKDGAKCSSLQWIRWEPKQQFNQDADDFLKKIRKHLLHKVLDNPELSHTVVLKTNGKRYSWVLFREGLEVARHN